MTRRTGERRCAGLKTTSDSRHVRARPRRGGMILAAIPTSPLTLGIPKALVRFPRRLQVNWPTRPHRHERVGGVCRRAHALTWSKTPDQILTRADRKKASAAGY